MAKLKINSIGKRFRAYMFNVANSMRTGGLTAVTTIKPESQSGEEDKIDLS